MKSWIIAALLSAIFGALLAVFTKQCFGECTRIDTVIVTSVITVVMACFLLFVATIRGKSPIKAITKPHAIAFMILSGIAGALSSHSFYSAINIAPIEYISATAAIDRLSVVFVLLFSVVFLGGKLRWSSVFGALFCGLGALLFVYK